VTFITASSHVHHYNTLFLGGVMILLVDDDDCILKLYTQFLEHSGYKVSSHLCPKHALTAFSEQPQAFKAIITDYAMPRMTGLDLITSAENIRPHVKSILYTGMPPKHVPKHITVLRKPARVQQVLSLLNHL